MKGKENMTGFETKILVYVSQEATYDAHPSRPSDLQINTTDHELHFSRTGLDSKILPNFINYSISFPLSTEFSGNNNGICILPKLANVKTIFKVEKPGPGK